MLYFLERVIQLWSLKGLMVPDVDVFSDGGLKCLCSAALLWHNTLSNPS